MIKNDITHIPFENLSAEISKDSDLDKVLIKDFIEQYKLKASSTWVLPQLLAEINSWKVVRSEDGKYCGKLTAEENMGGNKKSDYRNRGIWYLFTYSSRGDLLADKQYTKGMAEYCRLVPLILSSFKKFRNIRYSDWTNVEYLTDPDLAEAMTCSYEDFSTEELLQLRVDGMKYSSNPNRIPRNPATTYGLYNIKDSRITELPPLARMMLTQIWCAHPSNRNQYMILNPKDWDNMPEPLIGDIFQQPESKTRSTKREKFIPPWERQ